MLKQNVFEIGKAKDALSACQLARFEFIRDLPDVPVLSETILFVELALRDRCVDLARVSQLILSDLGAAIQVMRLANLECVDGADTGRIEDCISGLGLHACLDAMSKRTVTRSNRHAAVVHAWEHAREIASISGLLAQELTSKTTPEDATWVGLCHEIGHFPQLLGWEWATPPSSDIDLAGLTIAEAWSLPPCVVEYFADRLSARPYNQWTAIVDQAHQIAGNPAVLCWPDDGPLRGTDSVGKLLANCS